MERFVRLILAGGSTLVTGLWITAAFDSGTAPWLVGGAIALLGCGALSLGIRRPIEV